MLIIIWRFTFGDAYDDVSMTLILPDGFSTDDFEYFAIYCIPRAEDLGSIIIPDDVRIPASLPKARPVSLIVEMRFIFISFHGSNAI